MTAVPRVTCVIPVFNGERYLAPAIDSVLGQSDGLVEIVVVDDGSTDGTAAVARSFGSDIRYLHQENAGPATAINHGLRTATREFITVLDADDLWPAGRLQRQLAHFEERPDLEISLGQVMNFWETELQEEADRFSGHRLSEPIAAYSLSAMLARRHLLESVGYLNADRRHAFSTDWFVRVRERGVVFAGLPEVVLNRRLHPNNRSRQFAGRSRNEFLDLLKQSLDRQRQQRNP
jgi:glycosyltransferase involved in cell wall biosynthesis